MIRPLLIAGTFLTRLPLPNREVRDQEFGAAAACFPIWGFGIGALALGLYVSCHGWLGPALSACALVAYAALISGGLHLDGLADWFDALGGGRGDRERMLSIMRDPRIGAHGASALVIVLGTKLVALASLPPSAANMALLAAPAAARWAVVCMLWSFPSARSEGLGRTLADAVRLRHVLIASVFLGLGLAVIGGAVMWPLLLASLAAAAIGAWALQRLDGLTGDVHGAAIELAELMFYVGCARP